MRWQHPELGLLNPDTFLPLAEEMGLAVAIDRWVCQQVCRQLRQWQEQQLYPSVSINFSGAHLSEPDVVDNVRSLLEQHSINPSQLTIEVTESTMIADQNCAVSTLEQIKQMGIRVSLDDFGTGYCSLAYLSKFPVDVLKIDRSFIRDVGIKDVGLSARTAHSPSSEVLNSEVLSAEVTSSGIDRLNIDRTDAERLEIDRTAPYLEDTCLDRQTSRLYTNEAIVQSVLALADTLGIQVVAEGIEQASQCKWLQQRECTYGQGNFFANAVTQHSAQSMLSRQSITVV